VVLFIAWSITVGCLTGADAVSMASAAEKELAFAKAIEAVFNRWELLKLAVEHDFSGHGDSVDKAEWLYDCVLNYFKNNSMFEHAIRLHSRAQASLRVKTCE
jgi:hypothetical protein